MFTSGIEGAKVMPVQEQADVSASDLASSYAENSQRLLNAWRAPGALERTLAMPIGDLPGSVGINIILTDQPSIPGTWPPRSGGRTAWTRTWPRQRCR